jgi:hypothetical protein
LWNTLKKLQFRFIITPYLVTWTRNFQCVTSIADDFPKLQLSYLISRKLSYLLSNTLVCWITRSYRHSAR